MITQLSMVYAATAEEASSRRALEDLPVARAQPWEERQNAPCRDGEKVVIPVRFDGLRRPQRRLGPLYMGWSDWTDELIPSSVSFYGS